MKLISEFVESSKYDHNLLKYFNPVLTRLPHRPPSNFSWQNLHLYGKQYNMLSK